MRHSAKAALPLALAASILAGCSGEADRPARAFLDALDGIGLHKASYARARLSGDTLGVSDVHASDDDGNPVSVSEIQANRFAVEMGGWKASSVVAQGVSGGGFSTDSLTLTDPASEGGEAKPARSVGSYRALGVRATIHGIPVRAREVSGRFGRDGDAEITFSALTVAGADWDGAVRVVAGAAPGATLVSLSRASSGKGVLDAEALLSGVTAREAVAYLLAPVPVPFPKAVLREGSLGVAVTGLGGSVAAPDPAGFADPPMRALAEAIAGMVSKDMLTLAIRLAPLRGMSLGELPSSLRQADAYRDLGVSLQPDRTPADTLRKVLPLAGAQPAPPTR